MDAVAAVSQDSSARPCFRAVEITPVPIGFREDQRIARLRADIFPDFLRMNCAGYRVAEFQFVVANGMSADNGAICFRHFGETAAENLFQDFWRARLRERRRW